MANKDITMKDCSGIDTHNTSSSTWRMNNKHLFKTIPLSSNHQEHNPPKTPHLPLNPLPHLHSSSQNGSHAWTPWQESKPCEPTASLIHSLTLNNHIPNPAKRHVDRSSPKRRCWNRFQLRHVYSSSPTHALTSHDQQRTPFVVIEAARIRPHVNGHQLGEICC